MPNLSDQLAALIALHRVSHAGFCKGFREQVDSADKMENVSESELRATNDLATQTGRIGLQLIKLVTDNQDIILAALQAAESKKKRNPKAK